VVTMSWFLELLSKTTERIEIEAEVGLVIAMWKERRFKL